jgi:hypothetical protein
MDTVQKLSIRKTYSLNQIVNYFDFNNQKVESEDVLQAPKSTFHSPLVHTLISSMAI